MGDYITRQDAPLLTFYQMPKVLMHSDEYKRMSGDAKLFYMVCMDLARISQDNGWYDEKDRVFIKMSVKKIEDLMNCANQKASKIKKELIDSGLLENYRVGLNKVNRMYVRKPNFTEKDIARIKQIESDYQNDELSTGQNEDELRNNENHDSGIMKITRQESWKSHVKNHENHTHIYNQSINNDLTNNNYINNNLNLNQDSNNKLDSEGLGLGLNSNPNILKISEQEQNWMSLLLTEINLPHRVKAILKNHVVQNHRKQMREDFNLFDVEEVYWLGVKEKLIDPEGMPQAIDSMNDTEFAYMLCKYIDKAEKAKFNFKSHLYKWMTGQLKKRDEWDFENFRNSMFEKAQIF